MASDSDTEHDVLRVSNQVRPTPPCEPRRLTTGGLWFHTPTFRLYPHLD